jgi:hypothetical protein
LHRPIIFAQPFLDGRQAFAAAEQAPFPNQHRQLLPQAHQLERGFGAVLVVVDLLADGRFHVQHLQAHAADFPAQFVQSVVHGSLLGWSDTIRTKDEQKVKRPGTRHLIVD